MSMLPNTVHTRISRESIRPHQTLRKVVTLLVSVAICIQFMLNFYLSNDSADADITFYVVPECIDTLKNELNKSKYLFYSKLVNMTSQMATIEDSDYCLATQSCALSTESRINLEKKCKKIVVLDFQPTPQYQNRSITDYSKYHFVYSNCRSEHFRSDKDVCAPLFANTNCRPNSRDRQYSVSFKGPIYVSGEGMYRYQMQWLNHTPHSFIHFTCDDPTNHEKLYQSNIKSVSLDKECNRFNASYYLPKDHCAALNATFVLTPGGRQPASYRLMEALSVHAIPIPLYDIQDNLVPLPFHRTIDWMKCTRVFTEIYQVERFIQSDDAVVRDLIDNCANIYDTHFSTFKVALESWNRELSAVFSMNYYYLFADLFMMSRY